MIFSFVIIAGTLLSFMLSASLWLIIVNLTYGTRTDLFNALNLYKNRVKNVDSLKSILAKTDTNYYRKKELDKLINDARNNYLIPERKLSLGSRAYYSILSLPSYIELANQILKRSDAIIQFEMQTKSNALMESLPDTRAKRIELQIAAKKSFKHIKTRLTDGLPFSSVIYDRLISQNFVNNSYRDNWSYLHKKACSNQLVTIVKMIVNSLLNKVVIPMIIATLSNLLKQFNIHIN